MLAPWLPWRTASSLPSPPVMHRMVQWAQTRQRAISDARAAVQSSASVLYYVEMNLGPEAVAGKPGVTNDVIGAVTRTRKVEKTSRMLTTL